MKILRIDDVSHLTGLSKSSIYKQVRQNQFPQSIKLTARATGWDSREVEKWITNKINQNKDLVDSSYVEVFLQNKENIS
ncbi:MAG: helix-turn-helix transcriptional regulator [Gammaproteobacteria bacterium]